MNEEKRKKLVEAFADFASDYKDFIIKDSCSVSEKTDIYPNYLRTKVTFSLELAKTIKEGDEIYHKEASEFAKAFSDMYNEFQKVAVERRGQIIQNAMSSTQLSYLPQQIKMSLANGAADIALKKQKEKLTNTQVKHEVRKMINTVIEGQGKQLQNRFEKQTFNMRKQHLETEILKLVNNSGPDAFFGAGNWLYQIYRGFKE